MKRVSGLKFITVSVFLAAVAVTAMAAIVKSFPTEIDPGVPAYARIEMAGGVPLVHHDKDWAVIYFVRNPACVPDGFNLLDFANPPAAFDCPMTVEGFDIFENSDAIEPFQSVSYGLGAVPTWFIPWSMLKPAVMDGVLYFSELKAMNPVKGTASFFKETLHPSGAAKRTMLEVVARGTLEDGRTFDLESAENFRSEERDIESRTNTKIRFK